MRNRLLIFLSMVAFLAVASGPVFAHHSQSAVYVTSKTGKIEGTVKEFLWRNPHSYIRVEAPDDKGEMQVWVIEGTAPTRLSEEGMTSTSLRPGDHIIVTGRPGRVVEDHRMLLQTIERPSDGWRFPATAPAASIDR